MFFASLVLLLPSISFLGLFRDRDGILSLENTEFSFSFVHWFLLSSIIALLFLEITILYFFVRVSFNFVVGAVSIVISWTLFGLSLAFILILFTNVDSAGPQLINLTIASLFQMISAILVTINVILVRNWTIDVKKIEYLNNVLMFSFTVFFGALVLTYLEPWSYRRASQFLIVSFTTIGFGITVPQSIAGVYFTMFLSLWGIGLTGLVLRNFGNQVVVFTDKIASFFTGNSDQKKRIESLTVVFLSLTIWFVGGAIFNALETEWTYSQSLFFTFQTLTTIGYGNLIPENPISIALLTYYAFFGLGLFSIFLSIYWNP